ncbi:MAG: NAD(P)H-dependent oxidoreductase subunit E [Candidatus Omnitrophota bacterium]
MKKAIDVKKIDGIVKRHKCRMSGLIGMLQDIQGSHGFLPKEALTRVAEALNAPLSQVYSLATFYKAFSLKARGKYMVSLCMGTACHVRGTERILDELERKLKIKAGNTSKDSRFSLETVNCLGACALGPLMVINGEYYAKMNAKKVGSILKKYEKS